MISLPSYTIQAQVFEGRRSLVYRGYRDADRAAVMIKCLRSEIPSSPELARLLHEAAILEGVSGPGLLRVAAVEKYGRGAALVFAAVPGQRLAPLLRRRRLELAEALHIGSAVAATVDVLQEQRIIHGAICPGNLLVELGEPGSATASVHLVGFGGAQRLGGEPAPPLEGLAPSYQAPEQSGRMSHAVDSRADLYALGATLYELVTGEPPFTTADPVELLHCHLARLPLPPAQVAAAVPAVLSRLIMKLLAKAPEDRYQTAYGLKVDLQECLRRLAADGQLSDFALGRRDQSDELRRPARLYGRRAELTILRAAHARTCQGAAELVLVSGPAGTGKTALVAELRPLALSRGGNYIWGKFDQLNRTSPYSALAQALSQLVTRLLGAAPSVLEQWRQRIHKALGPNSALLTELAPELALVLGPQPSVAPLGPSEAENRFSLACQSFLRLFTTAEHPLVLFLDDLQWADPASLRLLQALLVDPQRGYLLIVAAYRSPEGGPTAPLGEFLAELRKTDTPLCELQLGALSLPAVVELVAAMLGPEPESECEKAPGSARRPPEHAEVTSLARLSLAKTQGNPFFLGQFLAHLRAEKLLQFDASAWRWRWDERRIAELQVTANVVELMAAKLQRLGAATQEILKLAACIGYEFELGTLALIYGASAAETALALAPALHEGLVLPLDAGGQRAAKIEQRAAPVATGPVGGYRFLHDRVQQAAYSLLGDAQSQQLHLRIGRLLLGRHPPSEELPFAIVDHYNRGRALSEDPGERMALARMNLTAGRRAKAAAAYAAAAAYLGTAIELTGDDFAREYDLLFALHREAGECEFLSGASERSDAHFDTALAHARTRAERGELHALRAGAYSARGRYPEAMRACLAGLAEFGITYPTTAPEMMALFQAELPQIASNLGKRRIEDLLHTTAVLDPDQRIIVKLYAATIVIGFLSDPTVMVMVMASACNFSLKHGHSDYTPYIYVCYGYLLASRFFCYAEAQKFGELALLLNKKFPNVKLAAKVRVIVGTYRHFYKHIGDFEYWEEGYRLALETGDYIHASVTRAYVNYYQLSLGHELGAVQAKNRSFLQLMKLTKDALATSVLLYCRQMVANLQGTTRSHASLSDEGFDEDAQVAQDRQRGAVVALSFYGVIKLQLLYLYGDYERARAMLGELDAQLTQVVTGLYHACQGSLWICLTLLALPVPVLSEERKQRQAMLERHRARIGEWGRICPPNYQHMHLMIAAESARVGGDSAAAMSLYEQAIATARHHGFITHAALASELAGRFYLGQGRQKLAAVYLQDAQAGFALWGAAAKVAQLSQLYASLLAPAETERRGSVSSVDLLAVIRASQALSAEIDLPRLGHQLLSLAIASAGAERGVLLRHREGTLEMVAQGSVAGEKLEVQQLAAGTLAAELPLSLLNYAARTRKSVVLEHAATDPLYAADSYVQRAQPKSVMCLPLLRQGALVALLYLENNLTRGAFTAERITVLEVLAAQAAISLENAVLYAALSHENSERRRAEAALRQQSAELEQRVLARTAELEAANRELEAFSYSVSHDLRAPLRAIDGFSRALQEDYQDKLDSDGRQYLQHLRSGCTAMSGLIEDLLSLAQVASGELERTTVNLGRMAAALLAPLQESAPEREVEVVLPPALEVRADARLLQIALGNLLANAWKYTSKQARARIELGCRRSEDGSQVFFIRDSGAGFDMKFATRLFAPFQRMHSADQFGGTGIGLATVQRIIRRHGGRIWAEAAVDQGATFFFTLE